jgi:hypothetical protein
MSFSRRRPMWIGALLRNASGQPVARMSAHVVDYARVEANHLMKAQREASETYAAAGIDVVWVRGNEEDHPATALDMRVVLLDIAMSNKNGTPHAPGGLHE